MTKVWVTVTSAPPSGAAGQGEELGPRGRVGAQSAEQRRGDRAGAGGADPAQAHAGVLGLDHDADTARRQVPVQVLGDLLGQPLLGLGPVSVELDEAGQLGQPEDPVGGQVPQVGHTDERQHVVLADRPDRDVLDHDQLVVALGSWRRW